MFDVIRCGDKELVDTRADAEEAGGGWGGSEGGIERSAVMVFVLGFLCRWALRSANSDGHASNYNGCFSRGPERGTVSKDKKKSEGVRVRGRRLWNDGGKGRYCLRGRKQPAQCSSQNWERERWIAVRVKEGETRWKEPYLEPYLTASCDRISCNVLIRKKCGLLLQGDSFWSLGWCMLWESLVNEFHRPASWQ